MKSSNEKDYLTRIFGFVIYILDYAYKEITVIPKDLLTEIHLIFWRHNRDHHKKILGYWDFNQRVSKLGDFINFLEYLNILRYEFNLNPKNKNIDICFIDDNSHYNKKDPRFSKTYLFKKAIKSLVIINRQVDSVFYFNSNIEFNQFYSQNKSRYIRWPPTVSGTLIADCREVEHFYTKNGFIPYLNLPLEILKSIYAFYEAKVYPALPIILNVRYNQHDPKRNSDTVEINKFLTHYANDQRYKFIIICDKSEIQEQFRKLGNVLFSKDYFLDIEYDLGLIKTSYLSIFPSSGMACFAWYCQTPFIQYGNHGYIEKFTIPRKGTSFNFLSPEQRILHGNKNSDLLVNSVEQLATYLQENNINNNILNKPGEIKRR